MFGKLFGKKSKEMANKVARFENKDFMEATCQGAMLAVYCNGVPKTEELNKAREMLVNHPALDAFKSEIPAYLDRCQETFERDYRSGKVSALREIADIQSDEKEKQDLIIVILAIVEADGEIDDAEQKLVEDIAQSLGMASFLKAIQ